MKGLRRLGRGGEANFGGADTQLTSFRNGNDVTVLCR
jgi:hypothetical protein